MYMHIFSPRYAIVFSLNSASYVFRSLSHASFSEKDHYVQQTT